MYRLLFGLALVFSTLDGSAQTLKTIDSMERVEQSCIDTNTTPDCSIKFYDEMDSLLNIIYRKLYARSSTARQLDLKSKQRLWLKKRDQYFLQVAKEKEEFQGGTAAMIKVHKRAEFVKDRVVELIGLYGRGARIP